jgi:tryptophanyl-tRNA synthetase
VPQEKIQEKTATLVGLDGRKMSKSYGNQIPLFCDEKTLKKLISGIKTDSSLPTEPKPLDSTIFEYIKVFGTDEQIRVMEEKFNTGISWAEAKQSLFEIMNGYLSPMREKYNYYMEHFDEVIKMLEKGEAKAKKIAQETIERVKKAVGVI